MVRSERLIKLRYSWFSAKSILVERFEIYGIRGRALDMQGGSNDFTKYIKTSEY